MAAQSKKQAAAAKVATKKKVQDAAALVKSAREAAEGMEVSSASAFKSPGVKLMLPSGNVVLVRNLGLMPFIEQGLIPNSLLLIVTRAVSEGKGITAAESNELTANPDTIKDMMELTNVVTARTIIQPKVLLERGEDDSNDVVYVDEIDLDDRMFIFQWCVGGTSHLEQFREQQTNALASAPDGDDVHGEAE